MTLTLTNPLAVEARLKTNNFDILRLVFAAMVVVFHVGILSQSPRLAWLHEYVSATFAVQAFFIVSGFLVAMSYERSSSLREYASKRFWRIAPAYVLVVVAAALLLVFASTLPPGDYFSSKGWRAYLGYNLILSNFSAPSLPGVFQSNYDPAVNASLWTIKIEVAFYCLVPVMAWMVRRWGYIRALGLIFALSIGWKCGFMWGAEHWSSDLLLRLSKQIPGQLAFFAGGAFGYYRTRQGLAPPPLWLAGLGLLSYALCDGFLLNALAPFAVTVIVYWAAISLPSLPSPGKYGDFSYGLYLYHFPIVQLMVQRGWFDDRPYVALVLLLLVAVTLSIVSWFVIEKRFLVRKSPTR